MLARMAVKVVSIGKGVVGASSPAVKVKEDTVDTNEHRRISGGINVGTPHIR